MTRKRTRNQALYADETCYCENCGISFIWTAEEQRLPSAVVSEPLHDAPEDEADADVSVAPDTAESSAVQVQADSFAANQESQQTSVVPVYCPGCRQLLPATDRERGLVKWYHRRKGYGFIVRSGKPDIYVHRSTLPQGSLAPNDLVEFTLGENRQGAMAIDVHVLDKADSHK